MNGIDQHLLETLVAFLVRLQIVITLIARTQGENSKGEIIGHLPQ